MARVRRSKRARRACLAALAALVLIAPARATAAPVPSEFYGVNMGLVLSWSADRWTPHLQQARGSGTGLVRADASWWTAEPSAPAGSVHSYEWSTFDQRVAALAAQHLRWYPVMAFSTPWSGVNGSDKSAPRNLAEYTAYVKAFAARYGRNGDFWQAHPGLPQLPVTTYEIWNEENTSWFWAPQAGAPERYADLYLQARSAIRTVDPAARAVVGGLSNVPTQTSDTEFLRRMYAHRPDLRGNVDAVAFHPYSVGVDGVYSEIRRMRQALRDMGQGALPLEITEVGWTTTRTPDADRAADLRALVRDLPRSDCNISRLIPYSWVTRESNGSDDEDWFGFYNHDGSPKPSGAAFVQAVREMTSAPPSGRVSICGGDAGPAGDHASARPRERLRIRVRVRGSLARGLRIRTRCSRPCRLRIELVSRRRGHRTRRLATRRFRRLASRRRARIHGGAWLLRAGRGKVRLKLRAAGGGSRAVMVRRVRRR